MKIYSKIHEIEAKGDTAVLCVVTKTRGSTPRHAGSKMIVFPGGNILGTVGGGEIEALCILESKKLLESGSTNNLNYKLVNPEEGDPGICGGEVEVYLEVIGKRNKLLIIGAGHVGQKLAFLANWLSFEVIIIDDREELLSPEFIPQAANRYKSLELFFDNNKIISANDFYVVLTTRNLEIDVDYLPAILKTNPKYVGVIGSKKRWIKTTELLTNNGILESDIEKIFSPIGLDLKSETPEEIALSIMAEIMLVKNNASGENLRYSRRKN
jgi:xanthine dehydrogenase accessory factor